MPDQLKRTVLGMGLTTQSAELQASERPAAEGGRTAAGAGDQPARADSGAGRAAGRNSRYSSKPPSSDGPYRKLPSKRH